MTLRLPNPMSVIVWLAFLVPETVLGARLDPFFGFAVFLLGCVVLIGKPSPWESRHSSSQAVRIFLLLEFSCICSFLYSAAFNGIRMGARDFSGLLRYVFLGVFVVYLIRHFDAAVHKAMEWAMIAALYFSLWHQSSDPGGYLSLLTLCYLLFFSRLRLRWLHASAALLAVYFSGARPAWMAALLILFSALAVQFYRVLVEKGVKHAAGSSFAAFVLCVAVVALGFQGTALPAAQQARELVRSSPIFGWGPSGYEGISTDINQYTLWLLQGGLLGAGVVLAGLALCGYRLLRASSGNPTRFVGASAFMGSVALMLFAGQYLESFRSFFLTAFFMASIHEASR